MTITGKYEVDKNFTTVYSNNRIYTIPRNARHNWGSIAVGELSATGHPITQEFYDNCVAECSREGTFELAD